MKISKATKYLLSISVFLILSIGVWVILYRQIEKNKKTTRELQTQLEEDIATKQKSQSLQRLMNELGQERNAFASHFVKNTDIVPFLNTIESLANQVGAEAVINTVDTPEDPPSLLIGIKASGSFEAIYKFMALLESAPYELQILGFDLKKGGASEEEADSWSATLEVKVVSFSR